MTSINPQIRINKLRAQFLRKGIKTKEEWFVGCAEYFLQNQPSISDESLFTQAYSQYLLADLTEAGLPCLPVTINSNPSSHIVKGRFAVQTLEILDICKL